MQPAQGRFRFFNQDSFRQRGASPWEIWAIIGAANQTALDTVATPAFDNMGAWWGVSPGGVIDLISAEVTTLQAGAVFRLGLYKPTNPDNFYPDVLIGDSGELSGASTGVKSGVVSFPHGEGMICGALNPGVASPTYRGIAVGGQNHLAGLPSTLGASGQNRLNVARSYAALPATFTAGATFAAVTTVVPAVAVRYA